MNYLGLYWLFQIIDLLAGLIKLQSFRFDNFQISYFPLVLSFHIPSLVITYLFQYIVFLYTWWCLQWTRLGSNHHWRLYSTVHTSTWLNKPLIFSCFSIIMIILNPFENWGKRERERRRRRECKTLFALV